MEQSPVTFSSGRKKVTPYRTKTGIEIGKYYQPQPAWEASHDMELLQESLLTDMNILRRIRMKNIAYAWIVGAAVFLLVVAK